MDPLDPLISNKTSLYFLDEAHLIVISRQVHSEGYFNQTNFTLFSEYFLTRIVSTSSVDK
jgi:hypothetical protein